MFPLCHVRVVHIRYHLTAPRKLWVPLVAQVHIQEPHRPFSLLPSIMFASPRRPAPISEIITSHIRKPSLLELQVHNKSPRSLAQSPDTLPVSRTQQRPLHQLQQTLRMNRAHHIIRSKVITVFRLHTAHRVPLAVDAQHSFARQHTAPRPFNNIPQRTGNRITSPHNPEGTSVIEVHDKCVLRKRSLVALTGIQRQISHKYILQQLILKQLIENLIDRALLVTGIQHPVTPLAFQRVQCRACRNLTHDPQILRQSVLLLRKITPHLLHEGFTTVRKTESFPSQRNHIICRAVKSTQLYRVRHSQILQHSSHRLYRSC